MFPQAWHAWGPGDLGGGGPKDLEQVFGDISLITESFGIWEIMGTEGRKALVHFQYQAPVMDARGLGLMKTKVLSSPYIIRTQFPRPDTLNKYSTAMTVLGAARKA